jgi:hypothetical protein
MSSFLPQLLYLRDVLGAAVNGVELGYEAQFRHFASISKKLLRQVISKSKITRPALRTTKAVRCGRAGLLGGSPTEWGRGQGSMVGLSG